MDTLGIACPTCGGFDTKLAKIVWDSGELDAANTPSGLARQVSPPVPRPARSHAARFYLGNFVALLVWMLVGVYLCTFVAARPEAVLRGALITGTGALLHLSWLAGHGPKPTADQIAAWDEWMIAHAEWRRTWLCRSCERTFVP